MNQAENFLYQKLLQRSENGLLRKLSDTALPYDFCSNDYLGFARSERLKEMVIDLTQTLRDYRNGATGSRLLTGNLAYTEATEQFIAKYHQAEAGLIFNSGYDANLALLSAIPQRGDTIITDELIHASLIDGCRLSHAERYKFKHNDLLDLEKKLRLAKGIIYVVVESVYSMDGDLAPLKAISNLCQAYQAHLIVDEAHAIGVFGESGKGLIAQLKLTTNVFARVVTFGKAIGTHGAIILGSTALRDYLINFARPFIYTTAAPIHAIISINCAYQLLAQGDEQQVLQHKISLYHEVIKSIKQVTITNPSAIQAIVIPNRTKVKQAALNLQEKGFDVRPILGPTVAMGKERLRICLHAYNSDSEIEQLANYLKQID
jgi:8-amino-7-oxononanoate synthase